MRRNRIRALSWVGMAGFFAAILVLPQWALIAGFIVACLCVAAYEWWRP